MDKIIEFLTSKIGYTLVVILGLLFPGMLFIFVWDRQTYFELGIIRLLILSLSISFSIFICNFLITTYAFMKQEKAGISKMELEEIIGVPLFITNAEMYFALIHKLSDNTFTISNFVNVILLFACILGAVGIIPSYIKILWNKRHKK